MIIQIREADAPVHSAGFPELLQVQQQQIMVRMVRCWWLPARFWRCGGFYIVPSLVNGRTAELRSVFGELGLQQPAVGLLAASPVAPATDLGAASLLARQNAAIGCVECGGATGCWSTAGQGFESPHSATWQRHWIVEDGAQRSRCNKIQHRPQRQAARMIVVEYAAPRMFIYVDSAPVKLPRHQQCHMIRLASTRMA